jgi:hypothetical protein
MSQGRKDFGEVRLRDAELLWSAAKKKPRCESGAVSIAAYLRTTPPVGEGGRGTWGPSSTPSPYTHTADSHSTPVTHVTGVQIYISHVKVVLIPADRRAFEDWSGHLPNRGDG